MGSGVGRLMYPNIDIDVCFPAVEIYLTHVVVDEQVITMTSLIITMMLNSTKKKCDEQKLIVNF
jgi:hypothetical protein